MFFILFDDLRITTDVGKIVDLSFSVVVTIISATSSTTHVLDEVAEMANLAQLQIQQQTTMALMAQAQQLSGSILQLLGT